MGLSEKMMEAAMIHKIHRKLFIAVPLGLIVFGCGEGAIGKEAINEKGALSCVTDKWDEKQLEKGHKLAEWVGRCVNVRDDPAHSNSTEECTGKYEYMPDQSWKGSGTCTFNFAGGDKMYDAWEEGSHLNPSVYNITGGTGKYQGASGGGTYTCYTLTETLCGGRFEGKIQLP